MLRQRMFILPWLMRVGPSSVKAGGDKVVERPGRVFESGFPEICPAANVASQVGQWARPMGQPAPLLRCFFYRVRLLGQRYGGGTASSCMWVATRLVCAREHGALGHDGLASPCASTVGAVRRVVATKWRECWPWVGRGARYSGDRYAGVRTFQPGLLHKTPHHIFVIPAPS